MTVPASRLVGREWSAAVARALGREGRSLLLIAMELLKLLPCTQPVGFGRALTIPVQDRARPKTGCRSEHCGKTATEGQLTKRRKMQKSAGHIQGSNVEAARAALRSLLGNIPVFQTGRQLAARLTISPGALMRNPGNVLLIGSGGVIRLIPTRPVDLRLSLAA